MKRLLTVGAVLALAQAAVAGGMCGNAKASCAAPACCGEKTCICACAKKDSCAKECPCAKGACVKGCACVCAEAAAKALEQTQGPNAPDPKQAPAKPGAAGVPPG